MEKWLKKARYLDDVDVVEVHFKYPNDDDKFFYISLRTNEIGIINLVKCATGGKIGIVEKGKDVVHFAQTSSKYYQENDEG